MSAGGGETIRVTHDRQHPYVVVQRGLAQNPALSFGARGLLLYLLSKPDDWQARMADLQREGRLGRYALRSLLHELEAAGHLVRQRRQDAGGRIVWTSHVYENPADTPSVNNPPMGNPPVADPPVDNRPLYNVGTHATTEILSTEATAGPNELALDAARGHVTNWRTRHQLPPDRFQERRLVRLLTNGITMHDMEAAALGARTVGEVVDRLVGEAYVG